VLCQIPYLASAVVQWSCACSATPRSPDRTSYASLFVVQITSPCTVYVVACPACRLMSLAEPLSQPLPEYMKWMATSVHVTTTLSFVGVLGAKLLGMNNARIRFGVSDYLTSLDHQLQFFRQTKVERKSLHFRQHRHAYLDNQDDSACLP